MGTDASRDLVERGDLDELTRHVDRLVEASDWDGLVDLRDRCRAALERGRQLWPVAAHVEYRLALDAPAPWAASVLVAGAGQFALGPLPEVAASTHTWDDLAPHVPDGPAGVVTAHERVVRGDDLSGDDRVAAGVVDLPLALQPWEPSYPVATYHADRGEFGDVPPPGRLSRLSVLTFQSAAPAQDAEAVRALVDLAGAWMSASNGSARAVAVHGGAPAALAALDADEVLVAEVAPADALALMAWTAASGGAHGRRRGMAAGRFAALWAAAALTGLADEWPPDPDELGDAIGELRWYRWERVRPTSGWVLRLAIEDPAERLAWAVEATDHR